jgi:hypothetical protein
MFLKNDDAIGDSDDLHIYVYIYIYIKRNNWRDNFMALPKDILKNRTDQ